MTLHNPEKDALQMAANRQRFLESGFRLFTRKTIGAVSLEEVARASGIGVATLYRYFGSKADLAVAISAWKWEEFRRQLALVPDASHREGPASEDFANYLDTFLDLYRNQPDLLRFNQFFNIYLQGAKTKKASLKPFEEVVSRFADRFRLIWEKGEKDGTLRTEMPWQQVFSATMHVMLAAVTRYAVGLVYQPEEGVKPEDELLLLRDMMLRQYTQG